MTQNQYLGADLAPLLAAPDAAAFNTALVGALEQVAANDLEERAKALAAEIGKREPHVVGLQEVWYFFCVDLAEAPVPVGEGCANPRIAGAFEDHLVKTLVALGAQGTSYQPAASVTNLNLPGIPFQIDGYPALLVAFDRDVILARDDIIGAVQPVDFGCDGYVSADGCNYATVLSADTPFGPVNVERGFVGVDVTLDGWTYRVVNTHLEVFEPAPGNPLSRAIQAQQSAELLQTLAYAPPTADSLIVLGDFNSSPEHTPFGPIIPPYQQFVGSGFSDVWTLREDTDPGYTCCQDADLRNRRSLLGERIDLIFSWDLPSLVRKAHVLGGNAGDKTPPPGQGIWPSDHGSVVAELQY
ncbi:MAG TPA: endonuclease/exonuclease/phosphatase family protein [Thermohalobaculum sp.]|nr:endonuclease/exonuclease/phosphatase family protein [Thermohalobaculum sp.]